MRVSREKAAEHRDRIIDAAGALFRAKGFGGIGVADIMKAADLTHGGFYGHFASKEDLVAQASRRTMARAAANWTKLVEAAPDNPYAALLAHYLSPKHRDDPGKGCAFAALGNDAARSGKVVRKAFAEGLAPLLDILAQSIPGKSTLGKSTLGKSTLGKSTPDKSKAARRRKAVAAMATLVGALTLARAVEGTPLSDEMLEAAHRELAAAERV
jgi:TetR/AcrR family transcriptional regulator, transcriptional repressor for nem operon